MTTLVCVAGLVMLVTGIGLPQRLHIAGAYCLVEGGIIASTLAASAALRRRSRLITTAAIISLLGYLAIGFMILPRNVDELRTDLDAIRTVPPSARR